VRARRRVVVGSAVAGAVVGALTTLALTGPPRHDAAAEADLPTGPAPGTAAPATAAPDAGAAPSSVLSEDAPADDADTLLVWTSGGLPAGVAEVIAALPGVEAVALVQGGEASLTATWLADGSPVDRFDDGWTVPLDVLAVEPSSLAPFLDAGPSATVAALGPGEALLTETSAVLRRLGPGSTVHLAPDTTLRVAGIVDDRSGAGAELLVHTEDAARLGVARDRYVLIRHDGRREELQQALAGGPLAHRTIRFRSPAETDFLRHGDAVAPQALVKAALGEFAIRPGPGRSVEIDPRWVEAAITTETVPILGEVTCHREVIARLQAAMTELSEANLDHLVDPAGFAGCYAPRRVSPEEPMSRHAWGAAVDLNVGANPRGTFSTQDPRLVEAMRSNGFTWGGTWLVPDPAHYEALP
jgi:hypothetical protein